MLEGSRPYTLFCFALIHDAMYYLTYTLLLVSSSQSEVNNCVLCTDQGQKANKSIQQRTLLGFIIIPIY